MCLVKLRDVSLGYGRQPVLEHVTLDLERGEFIALLGPNGAGKTTLLRGIVGLLPVLTGTIEYGFDRWSSPFGYVPQRERLDPAFPLSALEVALMGTYAHLHPLRRVGRAQRQLAQPREGRRLGMAVGQTQRVLIARALAAEPTLLVLDEPTAGVDAEATAAIMDVVSRLNREKGLTVVLVTHQTRMLRGIANAVVWVQDGRATRRCVDEVE